MNEVISKLPSKGQFNLPNMIQSVGVVMMLLGYGYQSAAKDNPDAIKGWGESADFAAIAGVLVTMGGVVLHHGNSQRVQSTIPAIDEVIKAAEKSAPSDDDGEKSSRHTIGVAIHQAIMEEQDTLAHRLIDALSPPSKQAGKPEGGA